MHQDEEIADRIRIECLGVRFGRIHRIVARHFERRLRPLGLSLAQLEVLSALTATGAEVRPTVLADWLAVERSTMSRNLAAMEGHGWIETLEHSPTGRSMVVAVTEAGEEMLSVAAEAWEAAQGDVTAAIGDGAASTLDNWLERLAGVG
jgi:DNA-binding MarR family transcriptional regulator